ncbi:MAG: hypothetical protein U0974_02395 [Gemmatimonadales bacterium]|nr:hypothetical protein [Gemmatimonadales bacterium]MDZ4388568.1 hypothetical protein [Gemmatimonadales bacterium]
MSGRSSRGAGMFLVLGLAGMAAILIAVIVDATRFAENPGPGLIGLLGLGGMGWILLRGPVGRAIAAMLEGGTPEADMMTQGRVAELEDRLHELTLEMQRLTELEDRLEFAERLLAERIALTRGGDDGR